MDAKPSESIPLRAGSLNLVSDRGKLRWLRLEQREALRAIHVAVRPPTCDTVPAQLDNLRVEVGPDAFRLSLHARHCEAHALRRDGHEVGVLDAEVDAP